MTNFVPIPDGDIDPGSPGTQALFTALRDNHIAMAEGAAGAPRIERAAIAAGVGHRWFYDYGDESDGPVSWSGTTSVTPGLYQCTTFDVAAGANITLDRRGMLVICATTSITINGSSAILSANGMGAPGSAANQGTPGAGANGIYGGSGGGGRAFISTSNDAGGATLYNAGAAWTSGTGTGNTGSAQSANVEALLLANNQLLNAFVIPDYNNGGTYEILNDYGEEFVNGQQWLGGGAGGGTGNGVGGDGGGVIILCAPTVTVASGGSVTANGGAGTYSTNASGGGGGGGAIIIATPAGGYSNSGTVTAAGGAGGSGAGYVGGVGGAGINAQVVL